jgi:chondroitin AC lyase
MGLAENPGTTVVQKPVLPHWNQIVKKGLSEFVGGVSNGSYGAATFDF